MSTLPPEPPQQPGPGEPGGYGAPPPASYGAPGGYGGPPPGAPAGELAGWGSRVLAYLIDGVLPFIPGAIIIQNSAGLGGLLYIAGLAFAIYSKIQEGDTGQGFGKRAANTRLVGELTGQPIGGGAAVGRYFLHIVDGIPCYLGFLWPLWDAKKQTFADKIMKTVVVRA